MSQSIDLEQYVPDDIEIDDIQTDIPRLAKNERLLNGIEEAVRGIPTSHRIFQGDARDLSFIDDESVHLVLTSPPYWTLKKYNTSAGQLGQVQDYDQFIDELEKVWNHCHRALTPGGRLICVVGDVCLSRRANKGRHVVVPLHASIQESCRRAGFDNLAPIIWHKIANAKYEAGTGGGRFLGKPYEPNAIIKNDIEFILMLRKPGGYRQPSIAKRLLSIIPNGAHKLWFKQIWTDITGESTRRHPAPFPLELAERLVRMYSFVGDTVLDPFMGTGTTNVAASTWGRNSIGVEIDAEYYKIADQRIYEIANSFFSQVHVESVVSRKK